MMIDQQGTWYEGSFTYLHSESDIKKQIILTWSLVYYHFEENSYIMDSFVVKPLKSKDEKLTEKLSRIVTVFLSTNESISRNM